MKKFIIPFVALFFVTIALISWKNNSTKKVNDNAAVHIDDGGCGMIDADGNFVFADNSHAVITYSGNGNIVCQADVANSTGQAVQYKDFPCGTYNGVTTNSHETISANGQATLVCHLNGSK
jgi:hypothetical protein